MIIAMIVVMIAILRNTTSVPGPQKVCKMIALMDVIIGLGLLFYMEVLVRSQEEQQESAGDAQDAQESTNRTMRLQPPILQSEGFPTPSFYPLYTLNRDHIPIFKGYKEGPGSEAPATSPLVN